jgi:hypothetical protein
MAVQKDKIQLELIINGEKAGATLKELNSASRQLNKEIQHLTPGTEEFKKKAEQLRSVNSRLDEIKKDIRGVGSEMNKAGSGFKQFAGGVGDSLSSLAPLGAAAIGAFAVDKLIEFGKGAISAFNEAENAAFQMHNALVTLGGASEEEFQRLMEQADALEATTYGFSAEQVQNAQKMLNVYGAEADEIENLIPKILDYATVTGQDLASATNDVISGFQGKTQALEKAGLQFEKGAVSTMNMSDALDKFKGSATSALDVGTNKTEIFSDQWGKVEEVVGGFLVDVGLRLMDWIMQLAGFFNGLYNAIQPVTSAIYEFFSGLGKQFPLLGKIFDSISALISPIASLPGVLVGAAAGIEAFVKTAYQQWDNLKNTAVGVFSDIGSLIYTAFTDPMNIGKVIDNLKSKFSTAATDIGTNFQKNYEDARKKYTISAPEPPRTANLKTDRTFKQETDAFQAESDKRSAIAADEGKKRAAITAATVEKVVQKEKELTVEQINDKNKELLKAYDFEEDLANRTTKAKIDLAILAAKTEEELLAAKIAKVAADRQIELQNVELTANERVLIEAKAEAEITALRKEYAEKQAKDQAEWADKEAEIIAASMDKEQAIREQQAQKEKDLNAAKRDAAIEIAKGGIDALLAFSQMETDRKTAEYEKDKDNRLSALDAQFKKGLITEENYNKKKAIIEENAAKQIGAIKTEQAKKDKAAAMLQAAINTAVAITAGMASPAIPPFPSAIAAGILGALQIALIAAKPLPTFARGGIANGPLHNQGGISLINSMTGSKVGEMEGGEPYLILSRNTYGNNKGVIDHLLYNSMYKNGAPIFAKGGILSGSPMTTLPSSQSGDTSPIVAELQALRMEIANQKTQLQAYITYQSIEESIDTVNNIRSKAKK